MADPWVREHGLSVSQCSEEVGEVTYPGPSVRMSETPVRLGPPVRQPGADGPAVLAEVGLADDVERLERAVGAADDEPATGLVTRETGARRG